MSSYCFTANNPVVFIDPDGRWIPGLDDNGNATYTAEKGDTYASFKEQYGLTNMQASAMLDPSRRVEAGITTVSGEQAKSATGNEILKLDINHSKTTDSDAINQVLFAFEHTKNKGEYSFMPSDYVQNYSKRKSDNIAYGDAFIFNGYTPKVRDDGSKIFMRMQIDLESTLGIQTQSTENKFISGKNQDMYLFIYPSNTKGGHKSQPLYIRFKDTSGNLKSFINKYNYGFFSGD